MSEFEYLQSLMGKISEMLRFADGQGLGDTARIAGKLSNADLRELRILVAGRMVMTEEGQRRTREALQKGNDLATALKDAQRWTPEAWLRWNEPFTI